MATITFGGLATGLNTQAIIEGLAAVERRPITLLQGQQIKRQHPSKISRELGILTEQRRLVKAYDIDPSQTIHRVTA